MTSFTWPLSHSPWSSFACKFVNSCLVLSRRSRSFSDACFSLQTWSNLSYFRNCGSHNLYHHSECPLLTDCYTGPTLLGKTKVERLLTTFNNNLETGQWYQVIAVQVFLN